MQKLVVFNIAFSFTSLIFTLFALVVVVVADGVNDGRRYLKRTTTGTNDNGSIAAHSTMETDVLLELPSLESFPEQRNLTTTKQTLSRPGNDGTPLSAFPLQKCQGDCDSDTDCAINLKCYRRNKGEDILKIPGCTTSNVTALTNDGSDYCYDPNDNVVPTRKPSQPPPPTSPASAPQSTPTTTRGTILYQGEDWNPRDAYPLNVCEGDCDGDSDCAGELVCHHRDANKVGRVPSCVGRDTTTRDYCIHPSDEIAVPPTPNSFRLKKYWRYGYKWQDEFWEQEWCMECDGGATSACEIDDSIIISHCSHDRSTWFVYKDLVDGITQIQIAVNPELCLQLIGNNAIRVNVCDGNSQRQKFQSLNGNFGDVKFELGTVERDGCLSQHHHPTDKEIIFRMDCAVTRKHTTSFWTQY